MRSCDGVPVVVLVLRRTNPSVPIPVMLTSSSVTLTVPADTSRSPEALYVMLLSTQAMVMLSIGLEALIVSWIEP